MNSRHTHVKTVSALQRPKKRSRFANVSVAGEEMQGRFSLWNKLRFVNVTTSTFRTCSQKIYFLRISNVHAPFLGCSRRKLLKTLLTNTIVIDVDLAPAHRACVLFYFHVISRGSTGKIWKLPSFFLLLAFTLLLFSLAILFRGYILFPFLPPCRESTVITVQSCYFSFIRCALFGKRLGSLHSSRFYTSAGGYMNSTTR